MKMQYYQVFLLCAIGKFLSDAEIYKSLCRRHGVLRLVAENTRLDASVIETVVAHTLVMCSLECINDLICKSINFNMKAEICEKLSESRWTVGVAKLIAAKSWEHYEPEEHKDFQNIALGKNTTNQPNRDTQSSSVAVDGNHDTRFGSGSCTQTSCCDPLPWWRVDFGSTALVYSIKVTNRGDGSGGRLSNFNVRVGSSDIGRGEHNALCKQNIAVPRGQKSSFVCDTPLFGRYLYIQTNLKRDLTLCEIEAFGEIVMDC